MTQFKIGDRVSWSPLQEYGHAFGDVTIEGCIYAVSPMLSWEWWFIADTPHDSLTHNARGQCPKGKHSRYVKSRDLILIGPKPKSGFAKFIERIESPNG
jgi:hypothetical protein